MVDPSHLPVSLWFFICLIDNPPIWISSSLYFSILSLKDVMKDVVKCLAGFQNTVSNFFLRLKACDTINKSFKKINMEQFSPSLKAILHLSWFSSYLSDNYFSHSLALPLCFLEPSFHHFHMSHHSPHSPQVVSSKPMTSTTIYLLMTSRSPAALCKM